MSDALDHFRQPAILATAEGHLVIANEAASRLFDPTRILGIDPTGKIVTCSPKATRELWQALEAASRPAPQAGAQQARDIIVNGNDQTPLLALSVLPLQRRETTARGSPGDGSIMILGREFMPTSVSVDTLRSAFGLSAAEARLLSLLATGATLRQAAEIIGVSYSTVMSQIKSCFQKTGTHRQAELIALAVRLGPGQV